VRKRLAQYYMEAGRSGEVRIDVPAGSYVPRFTRYIASAAASPQKPENGEIAQTALPPGGVRLAGIGRLRLRLIAISAAVFTVAVLSGLVIRGQMAGAPERLLARFWQPLVGSQNAVLLCVGDSDVPAPGAQAGSPRPVEDSTAQTIPERALRRSQRVFLNDAIALARIVGCLKENAKPYRIFAHSDLTFSDLQSSPAVFIGLRNNYWTANLIGTLRFTVVRGPTPNALILRDKKNPSRNDWSVDLFTPYAQPTKDYALVARELHPQTGQVVLTIGGITGQGTLAASEFITNPEQFKALRPYLPKDWVKKNMAIVLSTEVIRGSPGSAKIVAVDFW